MTKGIDLLSASTARSAEATSELAQTLLSNTVRSYRQIDAGEGGFAGT